MFLQNIGLQLEFSLRKINDSGLRERIENVKCDGVPIPDLIFDVDHESAGILQKESIFQKIFYFC